MRIAAVLVLMSASQCLAESADVLLSAKFRSVAEVSTFRNEAMSAAGSDKAEASQKGLEASGCTKDASSSSEAKAKASGKIVDDHKLGQIETELSVSADADGGELTNCIRVPVIGFIPVNRKKIVNARQKTVGLAIASAEVEVKLPLSTLSKGDVYELHVEPVDGQFPTDSSVQVTSGGLVISPVPERRSFFLEAGNGDYTAKVALIARATAKGAGEKANQDRTLRARFILVKRDRLSLAAPVDTPQVPELQILASGGEIEDAFESVGAFLIQGSVWCSGAVVGKRTIVTAAHCVRGQKNWESHEVTFVLGKSVRTTTTESKYKVMRFRVPKFEFPGIAYDILNNSDDIALVYVDRDFGAVGVTERPLPLDYLTFADSDKPISQAASAYVRLIGFGYSSSNSQDIGKGERRRIELAPARIAAKTFELANPSKRACRGDSGGPVVYPTGTSGAKIIGIVSAGISSREQASIGGEGASGRTLCFDQSVITRADVYYKWFEKFIDHPPEKNEY